MKTIIFIFLSLLSSFSFAVDYYWVFSSTRTVNGIAYHNIHYSNPTDACQALTDAYSALYGVAHTKDMSGYTTVSYKSCSITYQSGEQTISRDSVGVQRLGSTCPSGTVLNPATGVCDPPPPSVCEWALNDFFDHMHKYGDLGPNGSITNLTPPPDSICHNSCVFSTPTALNTRECFRFVSGDPAGAFCMFNYRGTDQECASGDTPATAKPPTDPTSSDESECTNKVTDAEGRVSYVCTSTSHYDDPGSMNCGEVDGDVTCYPKSPSPTSTTTTVEQDVTETPNPDGSTTTDTTTTTNTTNCSGVGSCSTTTSTTNTTSKTNADGSSGGETSTCTGAGCKDSDGKTQDEREEEEAEKPSVTGAESCDAAIACTGDVMQCEIIKQLKDERCRMIEAQDYESNKHLIDEAIAGPDYQMDEETTQIPSFVASGVRFLPSGACPSPSSVSVAGQSIEFDYGPFCSFATGIAPIVVGVSLLLAALFVGRGLGA